MKIVKIVCHTCGKPLNTKEVIIQDQETIKVIAKLDGHEIILNLSAIWNNFESVSSEKIPYGAVVEFLCPHCQAQIPDFWKKCVSCQSPIAMFKSVGEHDTFGSIMVCRRNGCRQHKANKYIPVETPASP